MSSRVAKHTKSKRSRVARTATALGLALIGSAAIVADNQITSSSSNSGSANIITNGLVDVESLHVAVGKKYQKKLKTNLILII